MPYKVGYTEKNIERDYKKAAYYGAASYNQGDMRVKQMFISTFQIHEIF